MSDMQNELLYARLHTSGFEDIYRISWNSKKKSRQLSLFVMGEGQREDTAAPHSKRNMLHHPSASGVRMHYELYYDQEVQQTNSQETRWARRLNNNMLQRHLQA